MFAAARRRFAVVPDPAGTTVSQALVFQRPAPVGTPVAWIPGRTGTPGVLNMAFNLDDALGIHQQALFLRARRGQLLASNLANADTPHYKARDFDFQAALDQSRDELGVRRVSLRSTHTGHIQDAGLNGGLTEASYRVPLQPSLDGNTVDAQAEQARFAENAIHYLTTLRFLDGRVKGLMTAIRGE